MRIPNYEQMRLNFSHILLVGGIVDEIKMEQYAENNFLSMINKEWIGNFVLNDIRIFKRDDVKYVYNESFAGNRMNIASDLRDIRVRNSEIQEHITFKW